MGDLPFLTRHGYYRNLPDNITFNTYQLNTKIFPEGHAFHVLFLDALTSVFGLNHTTRVMHLVPLFSHVAPMGHPSFEDPLSSHPLSILSSNGHKPLPSVSTDLSIRGRTSPSRGQTSRWVWTALGMAVCYRLGGTWTHGQAGLSTLRGLEPGWG